jgi:predicted RNase H-like HicB family nuclease
MISIQALPAPCALVVTERRFLRCANIAVYCRMLAVLRAFMRWRVFNRACISEIPLDCVGRSGDYHVSFCCFSVKQEFRVQIKITLSLPVEVIKKRKWYVACCPALDVSSQGDTVERAKAHLEEALLLFLESCLDRGVLEEVLQECGFVSYAPGQAVQKAPIPAEDTIDIPLYLLTKNTGSDPCHRA